MEDLLEWKKNKSFLRRPKRKLLSLINIIKNSKEYRDDTLFPSLPEWPHYSLARHIGQAQHPKRVEQGKDTDELMFAGRAIRSGEIYTGP